jgi:hypothetical protein
MRLKQWLSLPHVGRDESLSLCEACDLCASFKALALSCPRVSTTAHTRCTHTRLQNESDKVAMDHIPLLEVCVYVYVYVFVYVYVYVCVLCLLVIVSVCARAFHG